MNILCLFSLNYVGLSRPRFVPHSPVIKAPYCKSVISSTEAIPSSNWQAISTANWCLHCILRGQTRAVSKRTRNSMLTIRLDNNCGNVHKAAPGARQRRRRNLDRSTNGPGRCIHRWNRQPAFNSRYSAPLQQAPNHLTRNARRYLPESSATGLCYNTLNGAAVDDVERCNKFGSEEEMQSTVAVAQSKSSFSKAANTKTVTDLTSTY